MTTDLIERNRSIAYLGLLITVAGLFLLPLFLPIPPVLAIGLGIFGFVLTLYVGRIYSLLAGLLVAWSLIGLVVFNTTRGDARDTEEPIPVPAGYGFQLDPDSTNVEHMYDSDQMPPKQARIAAVHVVDYYINRLAPEWTVVYRQETPESLSVELRKGDTSQGIGIVSTSSRRRIGPPSSTFASALSFAGKTSGVSHPVPAWVPRSGTSFGIRAEDR
ncbi:MAG: hypothetical protein ACRDQ2_17740 [Gaiellales bacterium]